MISKNKRQELLPMDKKIASRFFTTFLMALFVIVVSIWALVQSVSYIREGGNLINSGQSFAGSSGKDAAGSNQVDMENLGGNILSRVTFETELQQLDDSVARGLVEVADDSKLQLYMGSGNYSDEVILVTASSEKKAKDDQEIVEQYLKDMRKSFEAYIPEQAKKISDALIMRSGCYLAVCVTDDIDNAKEVILAAFE